jgi:hypothetical protein
MSSRTGGKESARARAAQLRAAQARAERRRRVFLAGGAVAVVVVVVVALVVARAAGLGGGEEKTTTKAASGAVPTSVIKAVTSVPATTLDKVGVADLQTAPKKIEAPPLASAGKPRVLYVGAEYCPFCAAERWPVVVALSRFGTWSGLGATASAGDDVFPNTPSLTFHEASYKSDFVSFTGVELQDRDRKPLDTLTPEDEKIFSTYDKPPYTAGSAGSIPFIDLGGGYVSSGASFSPDLLAGLTRKQIAVKDPSDPVAQAIDGSANLLTAAICDLTKGEPANVCTSAGVAAAKTALDEAQSK